MSKPKPKRGKIIFTCGNEGWSCDETGTEYLNLFLRELSTTYLWRRLNRIGNQKWRVTIEAVK